MKGQIIVENFKPRVRVIINQVCKECNKRFDTVLSSRKFCCDGCRDKFYKKYAQRKYLEFRSKRNLMKEQAYKKEMNK